MVASKRKAPQSRRITVRHIWLAGLGAAAVLRREASALGQRLVAARFQSSRDGAVTPAREVVARKVTPAHPAAPRQPSSGARGRRQSR